MIAGGDPFYLKLWIKVTALERNRRFSISSLVASTSDSAVTPSEKLQLTLGLIGSREGVHYHVLYNEPRINTVRCP